MMPTEKDEEQPAHAGIQEDSPAILAEPKIENMEVHHHPDIHHNKKYWKAYFLEFLMIFLAVTLGFFADNLREQFKDHNQLHQYMQSLNQDLKDDIAMDDSSVSINQNNCRMIDTLILLHKILDQTGTVDETMLIPKPALLINDPLVVNGIIVHYQYFYGLLKIIDRKALEASVQALRLSQLLVKEYDLN